MITLPYFTIWISALLFLGSLAAMVIGRRVGVSRAERSGESGPRGVATVEAAIFTLLGLLVAFSFSGAASRFDGRRHLIVEESNAVGTAWLRLDLLAEPTRGELRSMFREYLDLRLSTYSDPTDRALVARRLHETSAMQSRIWSTAVGATREAPHLTMPLLPTLNEMFDIASKRMASVHEHPPTIIFLTIALLTLAASYVAGNGMAGARSMYVVHSLAFSVLLALTFFIIIDMEHPRIGLIRVDGFDAVLRELRGSMDQPPG